MLQNNTSLRRASKAKGARTDNDPFVFRAKVREFRERALLIQRVDICLPRTATTWLPRSQTQILEWEEERGAFTLAIPEWLAVKEGLQS